MTIKRYAAGLAGSLAVAVGVSAAALAATTVVVTPTNTQGFAVNDTRPGGSVSYVTDATSPAPSGALQLTTDASTGAKAQYLHSANTPLASVTELSYYTKQIAPAGTVADPSYQLAVCLKGGTTSATCGFSTLVFEPYQNPGNNGNAAVANGVWQKWDVATGLFWSTQTVACSGGTVVGTSGGPASYTLAQIKNICPSAFVFQYGVNIGSNNPSYNVRTDLLDFNGTIYDFELTNTPTTAAQCRNGGFVNFTNANGAAFTTQNQCIQYVNAHTPANRNIVRIINSNTQTSTTGNANSSGNTNGGTVTSGNASNSSSTSSTVTITSTF